MLFDGIRLVEGSEVQNLVIHAGPTFPADPDQGELFFKSSDPSKGLYVYQGFQWIRQINQFDSVDALLTPTGVTPGTYKSVTSDAMGRITAGTNPSTLVGYGIVDAQPLNDDLTVISAIVATSGLLRKTGTGAWALDTSIYLTGNENITATGDITGNGSTTLPLTLNTVNSNVGTYGSGYNVPTVTVNSKGLVTAVSSTAIPTVSTSVSGLLTAADKIKLDSLSAGANGTITAVTASAPLNATAGLAPNISIANATTAADGYLSSADWNTFNNKQPALGFTPENSANKNAVNGYAGLNASGKISASHLPALVVTDTFVVNSEAAMLALTSAEQGDIAVRTDINKSFILKTSSYSTLADWQELLSPTDTVTSVNGMTGPVVIPAYSLPTASAATLGGVKQGSGVAIAGDGTLSTTGSLASDIHSAVAKAVPADGDEFALADSAASFAIKKLSWSDAKTTLKVWHDTTNFSKLTVDAGTASLPSITTTGDTNTGLFFPAVDTLGFTTNGVERLRVDSSGKIGIGVTPGAYSESSKLVVNGTGLSNGIFINFTGAGADKQVLLGNGNGAVGFVGTNNTSLTLGTNSTERLTIDSTGGIDISIRAKNVPSSGANLSFDMSTKNNFTCTPNAAGTLAFTNITAGQSGNIILTNSAAYSISKNSYIKTSSTFLSTISGTGTYFMTYYSPDGTNVYMSTSGALS